MAVTRHRGQVDVVIGLAPVAGVECCRIGELVAGSCRRRVVTLDVTGIGLHVLIAHPEQRQPLRVDLGLPLGEQRHAVTLAIVDVEEGARPHSGAGCGPVVVQSVALVLGTYPQQLARGQVDIGLQGQSQGVALGEHRHPEGTGRTDRCTGHTVYRTGATGGHAVPDAFVGAEVHEVIDLLVIDTGLQRAPAKAAGPAQVDPLLLVVEQVHALVRVELLGHVLVADLGLEQVVTGLHREPEAVVARLVGGGADLVQWQRVTRAPGRRSGLEIAARGVVVRLAPGTAVVDAECLGCIGRAQVPADCRVVAAVEGPDLALGQAAAARCRELGFQGLGNDRAADAVTADADGGDSGEDLERADVARIDVGQGRVHVVGTGRDEVHTVDLDAQAIVGEAADCRQAGHAAGPVKADAGDVAQQAGSVAGRRAQATQVVLLDPVGRAGGTLLRRRLDGDRGQSGLIGVRQRMDRQQRDGGGQRGEARQGVVQRFHAK